MLEHLKPLSSLYGISGNEDMVREYIIEKIKDKCEYYTDNLGNLIAFCKGRRSSERKLMIAAHMDEVGMIVTYINSDGTLSFDSVGGINDDVIAGRQVVIYNRSINGVIGSKAVHNMSAEERKQSISVSKLYIDIGTHSKEETEKLVSVGDCISFASQYTELGGAK